MWKSQHVLGSLYERIYDMIRARGVPPAEETVLWACLARLKDPATGGVGGGPAPWGCHSCHITGAMQGRELRCTHNLAEHHGGHTTYKNVGGRPPAV